MNRAFAILIAGTFTLSPVFAVADDQTPSGYTPEMQAKLKQEADAKKAAEAKMTPEQKAAAQTARDAETLKYEKAIEDRISGLGPSRNMAIQSKLQQEANAKDAAAAQMTPEQQAATQKARDAETLKYEKAIEDRVSGLGPSRNTSINKSAEASKAGPTPPRAPINTP